MAEQERENRNAGHENGIKKVVQQNGQSLLNGDKVGGKQKPQMSANYLLNPLL